MDTADPNRPEPAWSVPPDHTSEGHRIRSRTIWALAQYDYLRGDSAPQVCDRYGLNERTLRDRAKKDGWRRMDQPDPEPLDEDDDDTPVDCAALADEALARVRTALRRRRPAEAASYMRVHDKLAAVIAGREERARRAARVDRAAGASAARDVLDEAAERMKAAGAIADNQTRLEQAHLDGALSWDRFDRLSALNEKAAIALAAPRQPADLRPSHPDFSTGGRDAVPTPESLDDPDP